MDRILSGKSNEKEQEVEVSLRPQTLKEYVGQEEIKNKLKVYIGAAKHRDEVLDHVLLYGPPGLGKTTLANIIANEMGGKMVYATGPSIEKPRDLAAILAKIEAGDVLFIDEIHRLPKIVEEILYPAMEDFKLSLVLSRDNDSKTLDIPLQPFTLVGATTRSGDLSAPLRARFGITEKINFYTQSEIEQIVKRTSTVFKTPIEEDAVIEISKRSRGTPRIANRIFRRVRDFANYEGKDKISKDDALHALNALKIDELGLDDVDIQFLKTIITRFKGGPVSLEAVSSAIGEEVNNLLDVYEPYLVQIGMINRTPRGRVATDKAYEHLKLAHQGTIFDE